MHGYNDQTKNTTKTWLAEAFLMWDNISVSTYSKQKTNNILNYERVETELIEIVRIFEKIASNGK